MDKNTEKHFKLVQDQVKLSLDITQEFLDMWAKSYRSTLGKLAQVPAFGPVREKQEKIMKSVPIYTNLYTEWINSVTNFQNVLVEATKKTFEKAVEQQVKSLSGNDKTSEGQNNITEKYKEFYNIWIDTYSDVFKDFTKSEHFASDMGKFTSVVMDFQKYSREMMEENYLRPSSLPTKTDIDNINKELYDIKKTVKELIREVQKLSDQKLSDQKEPVKNKLLDNKLPDSKLANNKLSDNKSFDQKESVKNKLQDKKEVITK